MSLNPASPSQLLSALNQRGVIRLTDTSEESLLKAADTTVIPMLPRYRAAEKRQQLTQKLIESIKADGRIHGQFNLTGTATGRFSSKEPNMQNVERGEVRECFIAVSEIFSSLPIIPRSNWRLAAAIAGEPLMIQAYASGAGSPRPNRQHHPEQSRRNGDSGGTALAKGVNFGLLYGQRAEGLVRYLKTSYGTEITVLTQSEKFISRFFSSYKGLRHWHDRAKRSANNPAIPSEIRTRFGRRRFIPKGKYWQRYTSVLNTPIQGGSNDLD